MCFWNIRAREMFTSGKVPTPRSSSLQQQDFLCSHQRSPMIVYASAHQMEATVMNAKKILIWMLGILAIGFQTSLAAAEPPRLGPTDARFTQQNFEPTGPTLLDVRRAGLRLFATPFNHADGHGDGPMNPADPTSPGGRPTLANNGTFLRINGLDAQTCVECHALVSTRTLPPTFGVGGFGGLNNAPIFQPTVIDVADSTDSGFAFMDGRLIVPPHLFGSGGVQLLATEMSADLAAIAELARLSPDQAFELSSKGVDFGIIIANHDGSLDTNEVQGVAKDLVIRPFGRKGEFATVRGFDEGAMQFHFGMQPVETVGVDADSDGDGVINEVLVGEMSALEIFITTMNRPLQTPMDAEAIAGFVLFSQIGCAQCHRPALSTDHVELEYRLHPDSEPYFTADLSQDLAAFALDQSGGLVIPLYSDLKQHDMGEGLAESFQGAVAGRNAEFITAKLWGVADSAPYLHDGRALTLDEAIGWHGGEAQEVRDRYLALSTQGQEALRAFLGTLRLPQDPNADVID